jgi:hypothetical protein
VAIREMILHPSSILGLSDGGAHCGLICDASFPTYLLTPWTRDRTRGELIPIACASLNAPQSIARIRTTLPGGCAPKAATTRCNVAPSSSSIA